MTLTPEEWFEIAAEGWGRCEEGDFEGGLAAYARAEEELHDGMKFNPTLNLLRHTDQCIGTPEGLVRSLEPTEDTVLGVEGPGTPQEDSARWMKRTRIDGKQLETNINKFYFNASHHLKNLKKFIPNVLVMSTGRCGTMSLYRLLQQTQYIPYHQYLFNISTSYRIEMMCRHIEGEYGHGGVESVWMKSRAAEWLGPMYQGRPFATMGHHDTIMAPVFACLHRTSKIVYLRRNPRDVFLSMYGKGQWGDRQLRPVFYRFKDGQFKWKDQNLDIPEQIIWYLKYTEEFSRALGRIISDRWIEISADKLFAQDEDEIWKLRKFLDLEIDFDDMVDHFGTVHNRKAHKTTEQYKEGEKIFEELWDD